MPTTPPPCERTNVFGESVRRGGPRVLHGGWVALSSGCVGADCMVNRRGAAVTYSHTLRYLYTIAVRRLCLTHKRTNGNATHAPEMAPLTQGTQIDGGTDGGRKGERQADA